MATGVTVKDIVRSDSERDAKDDQIAQLETQIQDATDQRYEERFLWILIVVILLDWQMLKSMDNWAAPVVIGILELIGLFVLAERCQVDAILPLIDRIGGAIGRARGKG